MERNLAMTNAIMEVTDDISYTQNWVIRQRTSKTVGFVPTMGALHAGHISLVQAAKQACDAVVVSIFVNPTQFAPTEDLSRYPRPLEQDLQMLRDAGVDLVFTPNPTNMYPPGFSTYVEPGAIAATLEGAMRPTHFRGVATVVMKLFQIVPATTSFFGQKDFQQLLVIEQMVRDLNVPMEIQRVATVRETDGLAMSSRNRYLDGEQRKRALGLTAALRAASELVAANTVDVPLIQERMQIELLKYGVDSIDYALICDRTNLEPLSVIDRPAVALIAARLGTTRLLDNILLDPR
jgi:pantoate--beta-alanine ligase